MILSKQDLFSEDQAVTTTAASTNYIDLGADHADTPNPNLKAGELFAQVTEDFATLTSVKIGLQSDTTSTFNAATTHFETGAIARATLVAGYKFPLPSSPKSGLGRYIRLYYTTDGSTGTAGKIEAGIIIDDQVNR